MDTQKRSNFVPLPYRRVSFRRLAVPLDLRSVRDVLLNQDAYYRTEFIVLRNQDQTAIVEVELADRDSLFSPITSVEFLSEPKNCHYVMNREIDVGLPSSLARVADHNNVRVDGTLVVEGRYSHVNFIHHPDPLTIHVFDVVPPDPPKLIDLVERVLDYAPLPAIRLNCTVVDMVDRARDADAERYLFPCRSSDVRNLDGPLYFLDEHPPENDWTIIGCSRTQEIHDHFYDRPTERIEMCPRELHPEGEQPLLIRCCQRQEGFERRGRLAEVPWGAERDDVEKALRALHDYVRDGERQNG